jgi:hypothetical protein
LNAKLAEHAEKILGIFFRGFRDFCVERDLFPGSLGQRAGGPEGPHYITRRRIATVALAS